MFPCQTRAGCPKAVVPMGDKKFCPAWYAGEADGRQLLERNANGDQRVVQGCFFTVMPRIMQYTVMAGEGVAAEIGKVRERTAHHIGHQVREAMLCGMSDLMQIEDKS